MKRVSTAIISIALLSIFVMIPGCQGGKSTDSRADRLAADESYRLGQQGKQLNKQISALTAELDKCRQEKTAMVPEARISAIDAEKKQLADELQKCRQELASPTDERLKKMAAEMEQTKKQAEDSVNLVMGAVKIEIEEKTNALTEENAALKAKVQKLEVELKQLKRSTSPTD